MNSLHGLRVCTGSGHDFLIQVDPVVRSARKVRMLTSNRDAAGGPGQIAACRLSGLSFCTDLSCRTERVLARVRFWSFHRPPLSGRRRFPATCYYQERSLCVTTVSCYVSLSTSFLVSWSGELVTRFACLYEV